MTGINKEVFMKLKLLAISAMLAFSCTQAHAKFFWEKDTNSHDEKIRLAEIEHANQVIEGQRAYETTKLDQEHRTAREKSDNRTETITVLILMIVGAGGGVLAFGVIGKFSHEITDRISDYKEQANIEKTRRHEVTEEHLTAREREKTEQTRIIEVAKIYYSENMKALITMVREGFLTEQERALVIESLSKHNEDQFKLDDKTGGKDDEFRA